MLAVDSPKKWTNEFVFFLWKAKKQKKPNSFVCFLGESTARQSAYGFIWPLAEMYFMTIIGTNLFFKYLTCSTFLFLDGKYHVLPSGDLHIFRVEENDASASYSCRVRNTLTNNEENSPPFHLAVDSEYTFIFKTKWSVSSTYGWGTILYLHIVLRNCL